MFSRVRRATGESLLAIRDALTAFNSPWLGHWQINTPVKKFSDIAAGGTSPRVICFALDEFVILGDYLAPDSRLDQLAVSTWEALPASILVHLPNGSYWMFPQMRN